MRCGIDLRVLVVVAAVCGATSEAHASPPRRAPGDLTRVEVGQLRKIASAWVKLGKWCVGKKLGEEARLCAKHAKQAWSGGKSVAKFAKKAQLCVAAPKKGTQATWEKKRAQTAKKIAKLYDKLHQAGRKVSEKKVRARFDAYLWQAVRIDPSSRRWKGVLGLVQATKDPKRAGALADKALALKPPKDLRVRLEKILDLKSIGQLVLRKASTHDIKYYFSLPRGFRHDSGKSWPVLVCVDGAGSNFAGMGRGYLKSRGELPCLIVSPCTFGNTNAIQGKMRDKYRATYSDEVIDKALKNRIGFDEAGLLAILKDLQTRYAAEKRIYITGFSGGGNLTYLMMFKHPDLVNAAAPACANFFSRGYADMKGKFEPEDLAFPIHIFTGAKDPHREFTHGKKGSPGIEPQTDWAVKMLKSLAYPKFKRTMVPGLGHSAARKQVLDFFGPYMKGESKRTDPLSSS